MAEKSSPAKPNLAVSPKAASPAGASARTLTPRAGPAGAPKAKTRPEVKSAGKPPTESAKKAPTPEKAPDLTGEYGNLALLFLLYTLQGIPMGLGQVFPMILKADLLFDKEVLELGAGVAALPASIAARLGARRVIASDGLEGVLDQMRQNLAQNAPTVEIRSIPWLPAGRRSYRHKDQFDVILFADGIYTERGALLLADAATALLRPGGVLLGALPDLRAGIESFEDDLRSRGLTACEVLLDEDMISAASRPYDEDECGFIAGGSAQGYRIVMWRSEMEDTESVTGVVPEMKASPTRKATFAIEQEPLEDAPHDDDGEAQSKSPQHAGPAPTGPESAYVPSSEPRRCCRKQGWPVGYAFFIFGPTNPVRMFCLNILESEVHIGPDKIKIFDNAILFCILVSSVGMAMDSPLSDPSAPWTQVIRRGDQVFAVIFALEMVIKLIAYGLFWCEHGYLKDGWNVLDGVVVIITVLDILMEGSGGGFLKTVRILRALRPLRLISRNQNLRVVAQTIFSSLQDLLSLMVVALLFLLIFALFATSMLSGRMYSCSETSGTVTLLRDIGSLRTPLCLSSSVLQGSCADGAAAANGSVWVQSGCAAGGCSDFNLSWVRATADTPICIGRCDPTKIPGATDVPPEWLCPRPLTKASELPSACPGSDSAGYLASMSADETRGREFMKAMQRQLVLPCGGITVNETGVVEDRASAQSCRQAFCPEGVSAEKAAGCRTDCEQHPTFCKDSCAADASSAACTACRAECSAACECSAYCEPLIKDAALCVEQGGRWEESLSQSFDNVLKAMLTLFEISTTEGWADVMYAACDSIDQYIQPMRDHQQWVFAPFFVVYMIFSNMFIINLSVGVIVDKFMDLKQSGKDDILLTPAQQKWLDSQKLLLSSTRFFDITDLDRMPPFRRKVYRVISSIYFSGFIMLAIALHSASMGMTMFPQGESWDDVRFVTKRVFSAIFLVEMLMKLFALRGSYWEDRWNKFDFFCVVVSLLGIVLEQTTTTNITGVTSVFRVARLFRLLNYLKGVKKIFAALAASIPKLVNVMAILLLLLTLYSILGVSLFSTLKFSTLDPHCNFKDFVQAFITLFRGSTGEAWNQIMHDIARTSRDIFNSGDWCTPDYLFDTYQSFEVLSEKCLIERPNSCHFSIIMGKLVPYAYWVTYTLFVSIMVMNLVIAVILESYEEGKGEKETEILEYCLKLWKERDPDLTLRLPMAEAVVYVTDAVKFGLELQSRQGEDVHARKAAAVPKFGSAMITQVPMKFIRPMDLPVDAAGEVSFLSALLQVLKLLCHKWDPDLMVEIDDVEEGLDPMVAEKLKMEKILQIKHRVLKANRGAFVKDHVAALKIQRIIRDRRAAKSLAVRRAGQRHSFQDQVS